MKLLTSIIVSFTLALSSVSALSATTEKSYKPGTFKNIENHTFGSIKLNQQDETSVSVIADDELLEYLVVELKDDTLVIRLKDKSVFSWRKSFKQNELKISISTPDIEGIYLNGSGDLDASDIVSPVLTVGIHGSGDAHLGNVDTENLSIGIYGSGTVDARNLASESAKFSIHGSGKMTFASVVSSFNVIGIHGSGNFRSNLFEGKEMKVNIHGSGDIKMPDIDFQSIEGAIHGSGDITLGGKARTVNVRKHGSGNVNTSRLSNN